MRALLERAVCIVAAAFSAAASAADLTPLVRLEPGLQIVAAVHQGGVDLEGLRTIEAADDTGIVIGFVWTEASGAVHSATRAVRREDLDSASRMNVSFHRGAELHGVYFDSGSAALLPSSDAALERAAALLAQHIDWHVTIEGHTDAIGSDAANASLSERRAEAVRAALTARFGVAESRITARGFGESRPIESNDSLEGRARNRRVELSRACGGEPRAP